MVSTIVTPLLALSLINHQEPRFLLPLTLPIVLLHAPKLQNGFATKNPFTSTTSPQYYRRYLHLFYRHVLSAKASSGGALLKYWYIINIAMTLFFGFIHQGGTVQLANHLAGSLSSIQNRNIHTHLVTSHIYNIPMSLFFLPSTNTVLMNAQTGQKYRRNKRLFLYEYGSMDMDQLYHKLKLILDVCEMKAAGKQQQRYQLYLAIPSSLSEELSLAFWRSNTTLVKHERVKVFYPHLSTEAMPTFFISHLTEIKMNLFAGSGGGGGVQRSEKSDDDEATSSSSSAKCGLYDQISRDVEVGDEDDDFDDNLQRQRQNQMISISMVLKQFSSIIHQFGLALYRIDVGRNRSFMQ